MQVFSIVSWAVDHYQREFQAWTVSSYSECNIVMMMKPPYIAICLYLSPFLLIAVIGIAENFRIIFYEIRFFPTIIQYLSVYFC